MATTNNNTKLLDTKQWEFMTPAPAASVAGSFIVSSRHYRQQQLYMVSNTVAYLYNPNEDGWVQIPSPAMPANSVNPGASGTSGAVGPTGSSTAGTTTTLTTNLTLTRDLRGYSVYFTSGSVSGSLATIASNTVGANSVITFTAPLSASVGVGSTYRLLTPRFYAVGAGTLAAGSFRAYDYATNAWTSLAITGLAASLATDGKLTATPSWIDNGFVSFATGSVTAATVNTLTNNTRTWTTNQWTNSQVRITAGTGAGQIRTISSNTATQLTVSANWTITPDTTSQYSIEGNDDFLYYMGNNAVTLYRYSISANTWSTLTPTAARATAPGAGMSGQWIWNQPEPDWNNENNIQNGRYLYSFQGNAGASLHRYDIALNTWNTVTYSPQTETFTTGTKHVYASGYLYSQKDATGRWFRFNPATSEQDGWGQFLYPNGAAIVGDTCFDVQYQDGNTKITYVYMLLNTSTVMLRCMVI